LIDFCMKNEAKNILECFGMVWSGLELREKLAGREGLATRLISY